MRHYEFIREYSRDKTVENWGKKIAARVEQDRTLKSNFKDVTEPEQITKFVADFVIEPLERADPTKNNQYVQNLIKFYIAGEQLEDLTSTAVDYLKKFHKLKAKKQIPSPRNDINRYANFGDFASVIDEYPDPEKAEKSKGDAQEVYKDANVRIITPKNTEAACYYGQGTKWCTAARSNNMFDQYHKMGDMYIIMPTKPKYEGEKYQFHFQSGQFMDEQDREVDMYKVLKQYPSIRNIKTITDWAKRKIVPALMSDEDYAEWKKETNEHILRNRVMHGDMYTLSLNQPGTTLDTWKISRTTIEMLVEKNMMKGNSWANLAGTEYIAYGWFDAKSDACLGLTYAELGEEPESAVLTVSSVDFEKAEELSNEPEVEKLEKFLKGMVRIEDEAQTSSLAQEQYEKAINQLLDSYGYPMSATGYSGGEPERA